MSRKRSVSWRDGGFDRGLAGVLKATLEAALELAIAVSAAA
jgi:hypothetical protein